MSGSNIDSGDNNNDPAGHTGTQNSDDNGDDGEHSSFNHQSTPERWILVLAITILGFGVILLTLRSVVFSLILITIGVSLFAYWLYLGVRSKEQQHHSLPEIKPEAKEREHACTCPICKHTEPRSCVERRCPCCILTRNKQIIGHFNNPLQ